MATDRPDDRPDQPQPTERSEPSAEENARSADLFNSRLQDSAPRPSTVGDLLINADQEARKDPGAEQALTRTMESDPDVSLAEAGFVDVNVGERGGRLDLFRGVQGDSLERVVTNDYAAHRDYIGAAADTVIAPQGGRGPRDTSVVGISFFLNPDKAPITGRFDAVRESAVAPSGFAFHADGQEFGGRAATGHRLFVNTEPKTVREIYEAYRDMMQTYGVPNVGNKKVSDEPMRTRTPGYDELTGR